MKYYKKYQQPYKDDNMCEMRSTFVKRMLKCSTLDEKIALTKSALLTKKYQGYRHNHVIYQQCSCLKEISEQQKKESIQQNKRQVQKKESIQVCIGTDGVSQLNLDKVSVEQNNKISYFKQTQQKQIQTQPFFQQQKKTVRFNNDQKQNIEVEYVCSFAQIQLTQSKISIGSVEGQNQYFSKQQMQFDTCCSFGTKSLFLKKKNTFQQQQQQYRQKSQAQIKNLKQQVVSLKSQMQIIDEEKNKWMKKAMKYSSKISGVKKQMQRFEKSYENIQQTKNEKSSKSSNVLLSSVENTNN